MFEAHVSDLHSDFSFVVDLVVVRVIFNDTKESEI